MLPPPGPDPDFDFGQGPPAREARRRNAEAMLLLILNEQNGIGYGKRLFIAKRNDWIDAGGPPSGYVACSERHKRQHHGYYSRCGQVHRTNFE
jgi:hypothetical protein